MFQEPNTPPSHNWTFLQLNKCEALLNGPHFSPAAAAAAAAPAPAPAAAAAAASDPGTKAPQMLFKSSSNAPWKLSESSLKALLKLLEISIKAL